MFLKFTVYDTHWEDKLVGIHKRFFQTEILIAFIGILNILKVNY